MIEAIEARIEAEENRLYGKVMSKHVPIREMAGKTVGLAKSDGEGPGVFIRYIDGGWTCIAQTCEYYQVEMVGDEMDLQSAKKHGLLTVADFRHLDDLNKEHQTLTQDSQVSESLSRLVKEHGIDKIKELLK